MKKPDRLTPIGFSIILAERAGFEALTKNRLPINHLAGPNFDQEHSGVRSVQV